ncbi:MAG: hypothetical protein JSS72_03850 [Armatimonadetes bacterium]|nr:hypothetical protein [Armatimonadota bacterium]
MMPRVLALLAFMAGLSLARGQAQPLQMEVRSIYQPWTSADVYPVSVILKNNGPDTSGRIDVIGSAQPTSYPIDLPTGSNKQLTLYLRPSYESIKLELITGAGRLEARLDPVSPQTETRALLISDAPGEMAFLRNLGVPQIRRSRQQPQVLDDSISDGYVTPNLAPSRQVGYRGISAVVLGATAERLNTDQIEAIKQWLLMGGTLILTGGASAPILNDPRWRDLLPVKNLHAEALTSAKELKRLGHTSKAPLATVTTGDLVTGAVGTYDGKQLLYASRSFGMGRVRYIAVNVFEPPLSQWAGRRRFFVTAAGIRTSSDIEEQVNEGDSMTDIAQYRPPGLNPNSREFDGLAPEADPSDDPHDPFGLKIMPAERILAVLAAYFVLVIPINFLFLRRIKRAELAWFTVPILSLGFGGILFASVGDLYKAKAATLSNGWLYVQDGYKTAMFYGRTGIFEPSAGAYDMGLSGVDALIPRGFRYGIDNADFDAVDDGEIHVPHMEFGNLSFQTIAYEQKIPLDSIRFYVHRGGPTGYMGEIINGSKYRIGAGKIYDAEGDRPVTQIDAGGRMSIPLRFKKGPGDIFRTSLDATIIGLHPGPQVGVADDRRSNIHLNLYPSWSETP